MSNQALTWAFNRPDLKPGPKFVLVVLADMADEADSCYPGIPTIAKRTGGGERAVRDQLDILLASGYVTEERRTRANGARTSNRYRLHLDRLAAESAGGVQAAESADLAAESAGPKRQNLQGKVNPQISNPQDEPSESAALQPTTPGQRFAQPLCDVLVAAIVANGSKRPTVTQKWLDAARLLVDRDERDPYQARALIEWALTDEFWRGNIESMPTFRRQYDKLRLAAQRVQRQTQAGVVDQGRSVDDELRRRAENGRNAGQHGDHEGGAVGPAIEAGRR